MKLINFQIEEKLVKVLINYLPRKLAKSLPLAKSRSVFVMLINVVEIEIDGCD
jgi:hypothetical protein